MKWLIVVGVFVGVGALAVPTYADEIVLAADIWCPITCEPNTEAPGYMVEIAQTVFAKAGHRVTYEVLPWTRAIKECREGDISGIIGAYLEDAPDFIFPDNELGRLGNEIFVQSENPWRYTGLASLENMTLGVIADYAYSEELNAYILTYQDDPEKIQIATGEIPLESNIRKLDRGRLDAVLETAPVFWYTVGQLGLQGRFLSAGIAAEPQDAYIAFSPGIPQSQEYARILSEGVAVLRASGELSQILQKYNRLYTK